MTGATPALIYILGVGRSGSTLLERLLASAPGAAGMGEAHCLWRLPLAELTCSCGAPGPDCGVWREAMARAGIGEKQLAQLRELEATTIRHHRIARAGFSLRRLARSPDIRTFLAMQSALFAAFAEVSDANLLIDSSKAAPRAWALAALPETRLIRITRDANAVSTSWTRRKHDPSLGEAMPERSARDIWRERAIANTSAALLSHRTGMAEIRYEDLATDPRGALQKALGPGIANAVRWSGARNFAPDPNYHSLSGNPDRFSSGSIEIRPLAAPTTENSERKAA